MKVKQVEGLQATLNEMAYVQSPAEEDIIGNELAMFEANEDRSLVSSGVSVNDSSAASPSILWTSNKFGDAALKNTGTTSGTVCAGDDSRLSNVRTPSDSSVTYDKLHNSLKTRSTISALNIDWSSASIFTKSLGAATTFTFSNLQLNKVITLILTGDYTVTLPSYCKRISGTYKGSESNYIQFHCTSDTENAEEVWYTINKQA